jgi:hypothetical protein
MRTSFSLLPHKPPFFFISEGKRKRKENILSGKAKDFDHKSD